MQKTRPKRPKRKRKWTPTKVRYLEDNVAHMSYSAVAAHVNMSPGAVRRKAIQLGIQRDYCIGYVKDEFGDYWQWQYTRQRWTDKEKKFLHANHDKFLVVELAQILQRKYNSVYQQLRVMGYTPLTTKDWRVVFIRYVKGMYVDRDDPVLVDMLEKAAFRLNYRPMTLHGYESERWAFGGVRLWALMELYPTFPTILLTKMFETSNSGLWRVIHRYEMDKRLPLPHHPAVHYQVLAARLGEDPHQLRLQIGRAALGRGRRFPGDLT
ncbi:MAG: hypothetical protein ACFFFG_11935 [Candidatus Thorarchaeota archaeon]